MLFEKLPENLQAFNFSILGHSLVALKTQTLLDNFDHKRFGFDGKDHSREFLPAERVYYFEWFFANREKIFESYLMLADDVSKRLYLNLIAFRLGGHLCVRIPNSFSNADGLAWYRRVERFTPSELDAKGMFGGLNHYDFVLDDKRYLVDCLGLEAYLFRGQYFLSRGDVSVQPNPGDFVIDGGACLGDTAVVFANAVGSDGHVYCFDPVEDHLKVLDHNLNQFPIKNITVFPYGLGSRNVDGPPVSLGQYAPGFSGHALPIPLRTIDELVEKKRVKNVNFIKLDVEGAEKDVLEGAVATITRLKPKLAISLYHKPDDIFELIAFVNKRFPFYRCYLGHYTVHLEETVLYCDPCDLH